MTNKRFTWVNSNGLHWYYTPSKEGEYLKVQYGQWAEGWGFRPVCILPRDYVIYDKIYQSLSGAKLAAIRWYESEQFNDYRNS